VNSILAAVSLAYLLLLLSREICVVNLTGISLIPAELFVAGGMPLHLEIQKLTASIWTKE
jgi:hypothetical protein